MIEEITGSSIHEDPRNLSYDNFITSEAFTPVKFKKPCLEEWQKKPFTIKKLEEYKGKTGIGFLVNYERDNIICIDIDANNSIEREWTLKALNLTEEILNSTLTITSPRIYGSKHLFLIDKNSFRSEKTQDKIEGAEIFMKNKQVVIEGKYKKVINKEETLEGEYKSNMKDIKLLPVTGFKKEIEELDIDRIIKSEDIFRRECSNLPECGSSKNFTPQGLEGDSWTFYCHPSSGIYLLHRHSKKNSQFNVIHYVTEVNRFDKNQTFKYLKEKYPEYVIKKTAQKVNFNSQVHPEKTEELEKKIQEKNQKISEFSLEELKNPANREIIEELKCHKEVTELLNRRILFTQIGGKSAFIDKEKLMIDHKGLGDWQKDHMINYYANKLAFIGLSEKSNKAKFDNYFNIWLKSTNRKDYKEVVFEPNSNKKNCVNLFTGFKIEPNKIADTAFYWKHLEEVLCSGDNESYIYVRKWLAHIFQKPQELSRTAIVIPNSGEGTGKGIFLEAIANLLGTYCTVITDIERLGARFNSHISAKLLINANEAIWGGDKRKAGTLKALITDKTHTLELKHKEAIQISNYVRLIVTSNEDWAVPVGIDDRRFVFLEASEKYKDNSEYFDSFIQNTEQKGFLESLMHDLMNEDIKNWNPRKRPQKSYKLAVGHKISSMTPVLSWWNDYIHEFDNEGTGWKEIVLRKEIRENFEKWCETKKEFHPPSNEKFWHELKRYLPEEVNLGNTNRKSINGIQERVIGALIYKECLNKLNKLMGIKETQEEETIQEELSMCCDGTHVFSSI